ncbi:hypothetical protein JB92DRAFT_3110611 [Gautieria morchelliformis]|nr:hypothetical protein JB92DRAFT_3110611 [Gautieria morchelliformis]
MSSNAHTHSTSPSAPVKRAPSPPRHPCTPAAPSRALTSPPSSASPTPSPTSAARTSVFDLALTQGPLVAADGLTEPMPNPYSERTDGIPIPTATTRDSLGTVRPGCKVLENLKSFSNV